MYSQLQNLYPILLSDTIVYDRPMMLYIGTGGSLRVLTSGGDDVTLRNVPDGSTLPILVSKVFATGSTVGNVLATQFDGDVLSYFSTLPSWVLREYSLAFDAEGAEDLGDYEAGILYFRDSNFNRVPATFSRTTTATRVNEQGLIETVATNVPRIDYTDGSAKLLMEPSRTNILKYSSLLIGNWLAYGINYSATTVVSPEGVNNANIIVEDNSNGVHRIQEIIIVNTGTTYTFSVFVKSISGTRTFAVSTSPTKTQAIFNLQNGTVTSLISGASASIEPYINGWYKCTVIGNPTTTSGSHAFRIGMGDGTSLSYQGDNTSSIAIWGAQLEEGSYPTSYIPTAGSAVTRNADSASKSSATSYIGQTEGTLYCDFTFNAEGDVFVITDGLNSIVNYVGIFRNSNNLLFRIRYNSSNNINFTTPHTIGQRYKIAIAYKSGDSAAFVNGLQVGTTNTTAFSFTNSLSHFEFLNRVYYVSPTIGLNDYNNVSLFPTRLTNAELQQLTL